MPLKEQIRAALATGKTPKDILMDAIAEQNAVADTAERAKTHALSKMVLPAAEWKDWKNHLLDGGGVDDDAALQKEFLSALLSDDQVTVWQDLPHIVKSWLKARGMVQVDAKSGSVTVAAIPQMKGQS